MCMKHIAIPVDLSHFALLPFFQHNNDPELKSLADTMKERLRATGPPYTPQKANASFGDQVYLNGSESLINKAQPLKNEAYFHFLAHTDQKTSFNKIWKANNVCETASKGASAHLDYSEVFFFFCLPFSAV